MSNVIILFIENYYSLNFCVFRKFWNEWNLNCTVHMLKIRRLHHEPHWNYSNLRCFQIFCVQLNLIILNNTVVHLIFVSYKFFSLKIFLKLYEIFCCIQTKLKTATAYISYWHWCDEPQLQLLNWTILSLCMCVCVRVSFSLYSIICLCRMWMCMLYEQVCECAFVYVRLTSNELFC